MNQSERLEVLKYCLRTRNIFKVRELLLENIQDFPEDKEFLLYCYELVKRDSLIFQKHNHELLEPILEKWSEESYEELLQKLIRNFSQMRYHLCMQLSIHFFELKKQELALLAEEEALLEIEKQKESEAKEKKKRKIKIKKPKRRKRERSDKDKHTLAGVHTTGYLLIVMILQLIYSYKY